MWSSVAFLSTIAVAAPIQPSLVLPAYAAYHRQEISSVFLSSYNVYRTYAFGHDELAPVSLGHRNSRNGWGATIIDAMSTMLVMGHSEV
jgi:mannosyl-oligosaccharide alpha-1,2-mannosidase